MVIAFISMRRHGVTKRQSYSDYDYSEGDKLDQIVRPFSAGRLITEKSGSATAQRVGNFHVDTTPFTNEMTIL